VGSLGREADRDGPADPARAAGDEGGLAAQLDHAWTSACGWACSGSPGATSSRGTSRPPGWRISAARASGIGSTESQSTRSRPATSSGRTASSAVRPRAGSAVHWIVTAPLVNPAPNATIVTLSPTRTQPSLTASARAIGTDAADVFPYLSRLMNILSIGRSR